MSTRPVRDATPTGGRRIDVLESALRTFARRGYRKTSMDDVARDARISRPGLYLYFQSKQRLLEAAVEHALSTDVHRAEALLQREHDPLQVRLLGAFELWAGRYTGPLAPDLEGLLEQDASLLGDLPAVYRRRFRAAVERAVVAQAADGGPSATRPSAEQLTDVLLALAAGTKRQAADADDFRERYRRGLDLILG